MVNLKNQINKLFLAVDCKDADGFISFLGENACFRFAGMPVVRGKKDIRDAVASFFSSVRSLRHRIMDIWQQGDTVILEGEVTYSFADGRELILPFVNIFRMNAGLISDYRIYIDMSAFK